tara:strand:- start:1712 stop:2548 length:837 start_codon:yes stop_codon:yes gene_type:complete
MTDLKNWIDKRGLKGEDFLGKLCKNNHEYLDTGKSVRRKNGRCACCDKFQSDKGYQNNPEPVKIKAVIWAKENREKASRSRTICKRNKRRRDGCDLKEDLTMWSAIKKIRKFPTVLDLVENEQKRYWSERVKTAEGKAEYQKHLYKTSVNYNLQQKEKNQRRKSRDKGNYNEKKSPTQLKARLLAFNNCCAYCNISLTTFSVQFDHVIPSSKGGPDILANLVPSCHSCNHNKFDHEMKKWFLSKPFYSKERLDKIKKVLALTPYPTKQTEMFHDWQIS